MLIDEMVLEGIDLDRHPGAQLQWAQKENDDLRKMIAERENTIQDLEHRLTLLTTAHDALRRRVEKLEKNKPIERIW